jgi:RNA polymerase sigma-70 factor (ECF subfamily)
MANAGEPRNPKDDVTELVARARAGDRRAFDALLLRYRPRIFALALHITGNASEADDITQDAFVRAYRHLARFEGRSHFFTWLYRIAIHRAWNARRDSARRRGTPLDDDRVLAAIQVDADDPEEAAVLRERYAELVTAFDELSPTLRTTVTLVALQGLSHKEAAVVLETSEGTVAWRIHEARAQLRRSLADGGARQELPSRPARLHARTRARPANKPLRAVEGS